MSQEAICPNCEATQVTEEMVTEWFDYGNYKHAFQAKFPVMTCASCSFGWRDHRSEELIDNAMAAFIQTRGWRGTTLSSR